MGCSSLTIAQPSIAWVAVAQGHGVKSQSSSSNPTLSMRDDHRPTRSKCCWQNRSGLGASLHQASAGISRASLDDYETLNLKVYGKGIRFGTSVHVITAADRTVRLTTWAMNDHQGKSTSVMPSCFAPACVSIPPAPSLLAKAPCWLLVPTSPTRIGMTSTIALRRLDKPRQ